jgi:hypothetical protein
MNEYTFQQGDQEVKCTFNIPDWDWGEKSNNKLRKMFSIPADQPMHRNQRLEFFLDYLLCQ